LPWSTSKPNHAINVKKDFGLSILYHWILQSSTAFFRLPYEQDLIGMALYFRMDVMHDGGVLKSSSRYFWCTPCISFKCVQWEYARRSEWKTGVSVLVFRNEGSYGSYGGGFYSLFLGFLVVVVFYYDIILDSFLLLVLLYSSLNTTMHASNKNLIVYISSIFNDFQVFYLVNL
jgi:hypothetical protein